jgi:hypothetical protein
MWLDFIRLEVFFVGSFQGFGIIMSLNNFIPARLLFLGGDVISFKIMMISGLAMKFGGCGRTMMFA